MGAKAMVQADPATPNANVGVALFVRIVQTLQRSRNVPGLMRIARQMPSLLANLPPLALHEHTKGQRLQQTGAGGVRDPVPRHQQPQQEEEEDGEDDEDDEEQQGEGGAEPGSRRIFKATDGKRGSNQAKA